MVWHLSQRATLFMVFTTLFAVSCEKSATTTSRGTSGGGQTNPEAKETKVLIKHDGNSIVEADALKLVVPANAYAEDAMISINEMDKAAFISVAKLKTDTLFSSIPVDVNTKNAAETQKIEPALPLAATISVKDGAVINESTIAVVVTKNPNTGVTQVFYVPYSNFKFTPAGSSKGATVDIAKIQSGNFQIALVSGLSQEYIASHFEKMPADSNMSGGTSINPPVNAATSIAFADTDVAVGKIGGSLIISKASNEDDIVDYAIYFGSSATTKHDATPFHVVAKNGSNITYTVPSNTSIPTGPTATHFLVCTRNSYGEMSSCVSTAIIDLGVPVNAATSVTFSDTDANGVELGGNINIAKAANESDLTHYVIYWGTSSATKFSTTPVGTVAKTGANIIYPLAANTAIPSGATHFLVFTKNADGEMGSGVSTAIVDLGVPTAAATSVVFTDTDYDGNQIAGQVDIAKASSEADVTHYVLYWGTSATTKQSSTPIASIPVTGANIQYTIANNTAIPQSPKATHLLVFTKNIEGEMLAGVSTAIVDKGVPTNAAVSVSFADTDLDGGEAAGTVSITNATVETDLTHYVLYWGSDATTKQNSTAITTIAKTGSNLSYTIPSNTAIPSSPAATHLLVFTKNLDGEMATPVASTIVDKGVPTNAAVSIAFTDTDTTGGKLAGAVTITKAASEADVTHYVLYWGSNATTKQNSTAIATIAKTGSNLTHTFSSATTIPTSPAATHLLVYTKNADGEMAAPTALAIVDRGVPTVAATSVAFTDSDVDAAEIGGTVTITKASSETNITHYVLYWGSNATTKQNATEIANIAATGSNVTHTFSANTSIPTSPAATHLLVYTKNADGEMATPVAVALSDIGVPANAAVSIAFTDSDLTGGELQGAVTITKAASETDLTHYVLYWGTNATTKQSSTAIATIAKTGSNLTHTFAANTTIPASATHLLVFTKNADGEMASGVDLAIVDKGVPTSAAVSASMTDTDVDGGQIAGTFNITKAASETSLTGYVLYWGTSSTAKQSSTPITTIAKTGSNLTYTFAASTAIPASATHVLVFTENADGEMATGVAYTIADVGVPVNAAVSLSFTDTDLDGGQLAGTLGITKASSETDLTHYVVYWGTNATTKQSGTAITSIAKTGSNLSYTVSANTSIPASATHFLVYTMNADGEMATPVAVQFTDKGVPIHAAASIAFTDSDLDGSELQGTLTITKATDESDFNDYVLYWGSDATTKQSGTAIATIAKTGSNVTHTFAADTAKPAAATHFLVYTKNADGEMSTPTALAIVDKGLPTAASGVISFTDTDLDGGELAGTVTITKATSETSLTHYVLYWGSNSTTKQSGTAITSIAKTGSNVTYTFSANSAIPSGATHLLVYTKNADGEMASPTAYTIVDKGAPTSLAAAISFTDTDSTTGEIAGTLTITKATTETDLTHYVLYWGSSATSKQSGTAIATIAKTGANVTHTFSSDTAVPSGATHFLVYSTNADGESAAPTALAIDDLGLPVNKATGISFTDGDNDVGEISGTVTITKAANESDLTHYVLYWGSSATVKQSATAIATIAKTGSNVTTTISANTAIPSGATHFLVYTKNANGEMASPYAATFTDSDGSTCAGTDLTNSPFANWSGSDPGGTIIICTAAQFKRIFDGATYNGVTSAARMARNYQLNGSIDMAGETFAPIGNSTTNFTGNFNGQNFSLKNISYTAAADYAGVFGMVGSAGVVRNLKITISAITAGNYNYVGGAVGNLYGRLENVEVKGASGAGTEVIAGNNYVGGLAGNYAGDTSTRLITESRSKQLTVRAKTGSGGGALGYMSSGIVQRSFAANSVNWNGSSGAPTNIGGFVGYFGGGEIKDSYALPTVTLNAGSTPSGIGGFVGAISSGTLTNIYVSGSVCASGDCASSTTDGPLIGQYVSGTVTNAYWNTTTSGGWTASTYGVKRTTAEMGNMYSFILRGDVAFNFMTVWRIPSGGGLPIHQWQEAIGSAYTVASLYAGGDGSAATPWLISNEDQLRNYAFAYQISSAVASHEFKLSADITMTGKTYPWGSAAVAFNGKFRGNSKTISNVDIKGYYDHVGFFGYTGTSSIIENLTLTISAIDGTGYSYVGALGGQIQGKVSAVHVRGASGASTEVIQGASYVGGMMGYFVGDTSTRIATQSSVKQIIVRGTATGLGGFVGAYGSGNTTQSFASATVNWNGLAATTPTSVGGFAGYLTSGTVSDCFSTSSVTINTSTPAPANIGGFAGLLQGGSMTNVYSIGDVCSGNCANSTTDGPLYGNLSSGSVTNSYWSSTTSGWTTQTQTSGGYKRTGTELQNMYTYAQRFDNAFNFMTVWRIPSGGGYPIFQWQEPLSSAYTVASLFAGGTGASGNPWQITTEDQLRNIIFAYQISTSILTQEFILNNDIALTYRMNTFGSVSASFNGKFRGNNKTISNLILEGVADYTSLFGHTSSSSLVENLTIKVTSIDAGIYSYTAPIAGTMQGKVDNCHVRGQSGTGTEVIMGANVVGGLVAYFGGDTSNRIITNSSVADIIVRSNSNGGSAMGGLVGNHAAGDIKKSYAIATVNWSGTTGQTANQIGGFVGYNSGNIYDSYSRSSITINTPGSAPTAIGGFVGHVNSGTFKNVYHSGNVCSGNCNNSASDGPFYGSLSSYTFTNVYWNTTTTGWSTAQTGTYKRTTTELEDKYTFIQRADNAFDFMTVWRTPSGGGLPILQWQDPLATAYTLSSLFNGGAGTSGSPWQIATEDQLRNIAFAYYVNTSVMAAEFILTADIALTKRMHTLGTVAVPFTGKFHGNSKTISNLILEGVADYTSLFGYASSTSLVENLTIKVNDINAGVYSYTGALAGNMLGKIDNCHVRGESGAGTEVILGASYVGGMLGYFAGDTSTRIITGSSVKDIIVRSNVNGTAATGGFVGTHSSGLIQKSYASATVNWSGTTGQYGSQIGGFVGNNNANITDAYSRSTVTINTPSSAPSYVGGFAGYISAGTLKNVYHSGNVCSGNCNNSTTDGPFYGSFNSGTLTNLYWDSTTTGWSSATQTNTFKRTTTELSDKYTFIQRADNQFDFLTIWRIPSGGGLPIFQWQEPLGFTYAVADLFNGGNGSSTTPWEINSEDQLRNIALAYNISSTILGQEFKLTSNIALTKAFYPIGTSSVAFTGKFNGMNYTISNLTIEGVADHVGLFGYGSSTADVKNLNISVTSVDGLAYNYVGAMAGTWYGKVTNVHAYGVSGGSTEVVRGNAYVGGLIGYFGGDTSTRTTSQASAKQMIVRSAANGGNYLGGLIGQLASGTVEKSYSAVSVNWNGTTGQNANVVGGFAGSNAGYITNCYSKSSVTINTPSSAPSNVGGFVGYWQAGEIKHSYASGDVCGGNCNNSTTDGPFYGGLNSYTATNLYWDSQTSGWSGTQTGIYKRTTAEMGDMYMFVKSMDIAFDFMNVWRIPSGGGSPIFQWQEALSSPYTLAGLYAGGNGSSGSPWQIATEDQLRNIAFAYILNTAVIGHYFVLNNNIALTKTWFQWGSDTMTFTGKFNGANYTISNLIVDAVQGSASLLGNCNDSNVVIQNLALTVNSVTGYAYNYIGTVAGAFGGKASNVHVRGVSGAGTEVVSGGGLGVGGLFGYYAGDTTTRTITQTSVKQLTVRTTAAGGSYAGGLIGQMTNGSISNSFANATVNWAGTSGQQPAYIGGFLGIMNNGILTNNYSRSSVVLNTPSTTPAGIGGFLGYIGAGTVTNAYSIGSVCSGNCSNSTTDGPFVGQVNSWTPTAVYWNTDTSGFTAGSGTMLTNAQLTTDTNANSIVDGLDSSGWSTSVWVLDPASLTDYPKLIWEP